MALDVASTLSVRAPAALAIARMLLFTVFKILLVPVARSVLDSCSAVALAHMAHSLWTITADAASIVLSTASTAVIQLIWTPFDMLSPYLSQVLSAIGPYVPPPPIQYCALGKGINCGSQFAGNPADLFDLVSRLTHDILSTAWSCYTSLIDALSLVFFSVLCWSTFMSCLLVPWFFLFAIITVSRTFEKTPVTEDEVRLLIAVDDTLATVRDSCLALSRWFRENAAHICAMSHLFLSYLLWPARPRDPFEAFIVTRARCPVDLDGGLRCQSGTAIVRPQWLLQQILASPLAWYIPITVLYVAVLGGFAYTCLLYYVFLRAIIIRKVAAQRVAVLALKRQEAAVESVARHHAPPMTLVEQEALATMDDISPVTPGGALEEDDPIDDSDMAGPPIIEWPVTPPRRTQRVIEAKTLSKRFKPRYNIHPELIAKYDMQDAPELGAGANGFVVQARRISDRQEVAVKVVEANECFTEHPVYGRVPRDVIVMDGLEHKNIVQLLDVFTDEHYVYIVQELHGKLWWPYHEVDAELFPDGSRCLEGCMTEIGAVSLENARYIILQLVEAVHYLHTKGIAHCDIKPGNILIDEDFNIKLIDFGNAVIVPDDWDWEADGPPQYHPDGPNDIIGTPIWSPPELHLGKPYLLEPLDVWAIGTLYFTLLTDFLPFREEDRIKAGIIEYDPSWLEGDNGELVRAWPVIRTCLHADLWKRPSLEELKNALEVEKFWDAPNTWRFSGMEEPYYIYLRAGDPESGLD